MAGNSTRSTSTGWARKVAQPVGVLRSADTVGMLLVLRGTGGRNHVVVFVFNTDDSVVPVVVVLLVCQPETVTRAGGKKNLPV